MYELRASNTGVIIGRDSAGYIRTFLKKVTYSPSNSSFHNSAMLELAYAVGNQPMSKYDGDLVDIITTLFKPLDWRYTSIELKVAYYQKAILKLGGKHAISINLSASLARKAFSKKGLDHIRRAIKRELKFKLERNADLWLILETGTRTGINKNLFEECRKRYSDKQCRKNYNVSTQEGRPNLHGVIAFNDSEENLVKEAIRTVNGKANGYFIRDELEIKPIFNGMGWVEYVTKDLNNTRKFLPSSKLLTRTNEVSRIAKRLYESDRQLVIKLTKGI